jgi:hypothetical protein
MPYRNSVLIRITLSYILDEGENGIHNWVYQKLSDLDLNNFLRPLSAREG